MSIKQPASGKHDMSIKQPASVPTRGGKKNAGRDPGGNPFGCPYVRLEDANFGVRLKLFLNQCDYQYKYFYGREQSYIIL